jgi:hypothetical protein
MATGNLYPFITKAQIKAKLAASFEYRCEAVALLHTLQTAHEQATLSTLNRNHQGFMSSHSVKGSKVAMKLKAGEPLTAEDAETVDRIAPRYSRQLATFARAQAIANDPALAEVARVFSADKVPAVAPEAEEPVSSDDDALSTDDAPEAEEMATESQGDTAEG